MATNRELKESLDDGLKNIRSKTSELRMLVWRNGATADPKVLLQGLDELFEASVELEVLMNRERLSRKAPDPKSDPDAKATPGQTPATGTVRRKAPIFRP